MPRDRDYNRDDRDDDRPRRRDDRRRDDDDDRPRRRRYDDEDDFDRPTPKADGTGKVLLIVLSVVGIFLVLGVVGGVFAFMRVKEASARMAASNNLKQVGIALHSYHDVNNTLPSPFMDPDARGFGLPRSTLAPADRLSWRANILPYIEQANLYQLLDPTEAWNGPRNGTATRAAVKTFGDPLDPVDANTRLRVFVDNGALFDSDPKQRVPLARVMDGTSNTIMVAEGGERVPWGQFNEYQFDPVGPLPPLGHPNRDTILVLMADGSVKSIRKSISPTAMKAAITRAGNEEIDPEFR